MNEIKKTLNNNPNIKHILDKLIFPDRLEWFLVGGSLNQTIWNELTNRPWSYGISDYDIHYWDGDLSATREKKIGLQVDRQLKDLNIEVEVVNQQEFIFGLSLSSELRRSHSPV